MPCHAMCEMRDGRSWWREAFHRRKRKGPERPAREWSGWHARGWRRMAPTTPKKTIVGFGRGERRGYIIFFVFDRQDSRKKRREGLDALAGEAEAVGMEGVDDGGIFGGEFHGLGPGMGIAKGEIFDRFIFAVDFIIF